MISTDTFANRAAFARALGESGLRTGAEIGVFSGQYSLVLCQSIPGISLICVDTWAPSRNHRNPVNLERAFREAREKMKDYDAVFMRMTSLEAAALTADDSLHFVYIDALHDEKSVTADLEAWVPKVRAGGVVSGHDWGHQGVTAAVTRYAAANGIERICSTLPAQEDWFPSWYWVKRG